MAHRPQANAQDDIVAIGQVYRDRCDCEIGLTNEEAVGLGQIDQAAHAPQPALGTRRGADFNFWNRYVRADIQHFKSASEQLPKLDPWRAQLAYICRRIAGQVSLPTPPAIRAAPG